MPDYWVSKGSPWEIARQDVCHKVGFGGQLIKQGTSPSEDSMVWLPDEQILAMAYDTPIPGYKTSQCNCVRLWSAKPTSEFDLDKF